jgi:hypothetical protein
VGVVCNDLAKAKACTGRPDPVGDPFWIDYVAHEMGHQFGASHTWNGVYGSCSSSSFSPCSAYEPGSGSTIMAYAGICDDSNGDDNLQANSDPYFHRHSLDQILAFVAGPGACSVDVPGVNPSPPTADAGPDATIPIATPFELRAEGFDPGEETFTWEQLDLGTQAPLATGDDGTQPNFRSQPPTTGRVRVFPRLADLVAGTTPPGETLPVSDRTMTFRVTVRDNDPDGGREGHDEMTLTSTTASGPFEVTRHGALSGVSSS